jgi:hypothetical protein
VHVEKKADLKEVNVAKITFEFDPNNPDDLEGITNTYQANRMAIVISDFDMFLRNAIKYDAPGYNSDTLQKVRTQLRELIDSHHVTID